MDNRPIGVFDSGVGGLSAVKEIMKQLSDEEIVYFGDNARVPYGGRTKEQITHFSEEIVSFLLKQDVKAIVIACNTICVCSLEILQEKFTVPFFGIVAPGAREAARKTRNKKVGVLATEATVKGGLYKALIEAQDPEVSVYSQPAPLLVNLAEEGWVKELATEKAVEKYLTDLAAEGIDTLVLGCTHFPLLLDSIKSVVPEEWAIVNPAKALVNDLEAFLGEDQMKHESSGVKGHQFFVSGDTKRFDRMLETVLGPWYVSRQGNL